MGKPLSYATIRSTAKHFNAANGNEVQAAKLADVGRNTFKDRVRIGKRLHPGLFKDFPKATGGVQPKPATLDEGVALHRATQDAQSSKTSLKSAYARIAELEDKLADMNWAFKADVKPAEWTLPHHPAKKREHTPYLLTSDAQIGEVIDAKATEAGYGYDPETYRKYHRRLIDTCIYLSTHHGGKGWVYPGIIYGRGGDTIDGSIHPEDAGRQTLTVFECAELAYEEEAAGIKKLADAFGRVEVKAPGAGGNHDRIDRKPVSKNAKARSFEYMINLLLRREFHRDKRVTFQVSDGFDVRFPIYNRNILLTHGDRMGSRGGQGFVGPAATILRGWQKIIMEQAALGFKVHEVHNGHFHYPMRLPFGKANGCYPGYSEYAKSNRMQPNPPEQLLLYYHHRRGVVDEKPITLL